MTLIDRIMHNYPNQFPRTWMKSSPVFPDKVGGGLRAVMDYNIG